MSRLYDGRPRAVSEFTLSDGRSAVYLFRESADFSNLHNGYPLAEEFLDSLQNKGIDAIVIDDSDEIYVFDRHQYQRGNRLGHAPYPMKRVLSIDAAESSSNEGPKDADEQISDWEWVTEGDLQSTRDSPHRTDLFSD